MTNDDKQPMIPERKGSHKLIPARLRVPFKPKGRTDAGYLKTWGSKPEGKVKP